MEWEITSGSPRTTDLHPFVITGDQYTPLLSSSDYATDGQGSLFRYDDISQSLQLPYLRRRDSGELPISSSGEDETYMYSLIPSLSRGSSPPAAACSDGGVVEQETCMSDDQDGRYSLVSSAAAAGDHHHDHGRPLEFPRELLQKVLRHAPATTIARCKSVCKGWNSVLSSPGHDYVHQPDPEAPWLLHLTSNMLVVYDFASRIWRQIPFALDHQQFLVVTDAWSAGHRILVQLERSSLQPCPPQKTLHLLNPLTHSQQQDLHPFTSIRTHFTFGFGHDKILAVGFESGQCIVEVCHLNNTSTTTPSCCWQVLGALPLGYIVEPEKEILECNGSFYALCMQPHECTMLVVHISQEPRFTLHDIPHAPRPRLVACHDSIFMVGDDTFGDRVLPWQFDQDTKQAWKLIYTLQCPNLGLPLKIISVTGSGNFMCFCLSNHFMVLYDFSQDSWHGLPECPCKPNSRPLTWNPRYD